MYFEDEAICKLVEDQRHARAARAESIRNRLVCTRNDLSVGTVGKQKPQYEALFYGMEPRALSRLHHAYRQRIAIFQQDPGQFFCLIQQDAQVFDTDSMGLAC